MKRNPKNAPIVLRRNGGIVPISPHSKVRVKPPCRFGAIKIFSEQPRTITIQCQNVSYHILSGLFGRRLQLSLSGLSAFDITSNSPAAKICLLAKLSEQSFLISGDLMTIMRLADISAMELFSIDGTEPASLERRADLSANGYFGISSTANIIKGRLRTISEMDGFDLSAFDTMTMTEVDYVYDE